MANSDDGGTGDTIRVEDWNEHNEPTGVPQTSEKFLLEDFARLYPIGRLSPIRFHELVERKLADENWEPHARQFIHIDNHDSSWDTQIVARRLYTGYYRLNLSCLPLSLLDGWVLGLGRPDIPAGGADFVLTLHKEDGIRGRHGQILFHSESRACMIKAVSSRSPCTIIYNADEIGSEPHLLEHRSGLTFGSLNYRLEFTHVDKAMFTEQRDELMNRYRFWSRKAPPSLDPTPSEGHIRLRGYHFQPPQAAGSYGVVCPCIDTRGRVYAAKRVLRRRFTSEAVKEEIGILKKVSAHPHICSLVEVLYSDGDEFSMGPTEVNDVWIVLDPWAPLTLDDFIARVERGPNVTRAIHQAIQALKYLHLCGFLHRDVKPGNFLVHGGTSFMVKLADFGHSTGSRDSRDHKKGTIKYHAPEITALRTPQDHSEKAKKGEACFWSEECDIFSLGVVCFELLQGMFNRPAKHIDKKLQSWMQKTLDESPTELSDLAKSLLSWNAKDRPTLQQILGYGLWPDPQTPFSDHKRRFFA